MSPTITADLPDRLDHIYGDDAPQQLPRYRNAIAQFSHLYGPGPITLVRAPGRVNLIGEHTDYNDGFVLPAALDKDLLLLARPRADARVHAANVEKAFPPVAFALAEQIEPAPKGHWSNYLRAAAQMAVRYTGDRTPGLDILIAAAPPTGVPRNAGLSSSSALVVVTAQAFAHFSARTLPPARFAQECADAEWYVGTRGGIMDHFAAILARRDHVLFLDCRPQAGTTYTIRHIPLPQAYSLLVIDSGIHHHNVHGEFNLRVAACRAGVALLRRKRPGITHLRDVQTEPWDGIAPVLPVTTTLTDLDHQGIQIVKPPGVSPHAPLPVRACCRHVWHENRRVLDSVTALERGDVCTVGALLTAAHASARDDYAISTPELDFLVESALQVQGVAGARLTGAGWGGCVLALVETDAVQSLNDHLATAYPAKFGLTPNMFLCKAGPGACVVAEVAN